MSYPKKVEEFFYILTFVYSFSVKLLYLCYYA